MSTENRKSLPWYEMDKGAFTLMQATSAGIDAEGNTFVVLTWEPSVTMQGYNLYRTMAGSTSTGPGRPINGGRLIEPVRTCAQMKKFIPEGSREWNLLTNGFTALAARHD